MRLQARFVTRANCDVDVALRGRPSPACPRALDTVGASGISRRIEAQPK